MSALTAIGAPPCSTTTLGGLAAWATDALATMSESPRLDAELLLASAANVGRSAIRAFPERAVGASVRSRLEALVGRRRDAVPVAYLLGEREFYSLRFKVDPNVLVPRPETELVVDAALAALASRDSAEVVDLGTGSGAIALAIKHLRPDVVMTAVDRSAAALDIARDNATALGLVLSLRHGDWLEGLGDRRFDLIVSNPPYVAHDDDILRGPLRHEPVEALDGGADGLGAIRKILARAADHLTPGGTLIIEHGETQGGAVRALAAADRLVRIRTLCDLAGRDRVLVAEVP